MIHRLLSLYQSIAAHRMFSRWSPDYEEDVAENAYSAAKEVAKAILPYLKEVENPEVADIGSGTGLLSEEIKRSVRCDVTGIDFADDMLAVCEMKNIANTLVKCNIGNGQWPLGAQAYDAVVSAGLAEYLTEPMLEHYVSETRRILKKNGFTAFSYIPSVSKNKTVYWNGKTGGYLCCTYASEYIESIVQQNNFNIVVHTVPFAGCVFTDGSQYDYRIVVAKKLD